MPKKQEIVVDSKSNPVIHPNDSATSRAAKNTGRNEQVQPREQGQVDYHGVIADLRRRGLSAMADELESARLALDASASAARTASQVLDVVLGEPGKGPPTEASSHDIPTPNTSSVDQGQITTPTPGPDLSGTNTTPAFTWEPKEGPKPNRDESLVLEVDAVPQPPALGPRSTGRTVNSQPGAYSVVPPGSNANSSDNSFDNSPGNPFFSTDSPAVGEHPNDHALELQAVAVDDIMAVPAEPMDKEEEPKKNYSTMIGSSVCCILALLILVVSLALTYDSNGTNDAPVGEDGTPTPSPTLAPLERLDLLQEFLVDTFAPLYHSDNQTKFNDTSTDFGRLYLEQAFADVNSSQYQALEWIAFQDDEIESTIRLDFLLQSNHNDTTLVPIIDGNTTGSITDQERLLQRYALAVLYFATGGPTHWKDAFEFLHSGHECDWSGAIQCHPDTHHIDYIDLQDNGLQGTLPRELGALSHLETVLLSGNALTGSLPSSLALWTSLQEFEISQNSISGTLPEQILTQWRQLQVLRIGDNQITGTLSSMIGNLEQLRKFGAERMFWHGPIPKEFYQRLTNLEFMEMSNQLIGFNDTLPTEIGLWSNLQSLIFHGADLRGTIPSELGRLTQLGRLQLASNHFSGAIPSELGLLTALTRLQMAVNGLTGTLPTTFVNLVDLSRFELQNTLLTGDVGFLCRAMDAGNMSRIDNLRFDMSEVDDCYCCDCCEY